MNITADHIHSMRGAKRPQYVYVDGEATTRLKIAERCGLTVNQVRDRIERVRKKGRRPAWADFV
jgi:hypothetical protein